MTFHANLKGKYGIGEKILSTDANVKKINY